jgi:DNA-directed RNA polymerase subunit N
MIIPIRCFTCGKLVGDKWEPFDRMRKEGKNINEIYKELGITRFCCKRMLVSHVNLLEDLLAFNRLQ